MNESINPRALSLAIRAAWDAASRDKTRPQLQSVQISATRGTVAVCATDGYRAHRITFLGGGQFQFSRLFFIEKKVGKNALCSVSEDDGGATLTLHDGAARMTVDAADPEMRYPNVAAILPLPRASACASPIRVNAALVASSCESAALIASAKTGGVRLLIGSGTMDPIQIDADSVEFSSLSFAFKAIIMPMQL